MKVQLLLCVSLLACGGTKDESAALAKPTTVKPEPKPDPNEPFAALGSKDDVLNKWQGAWTVEVEIGEFEAWEIKGNKLTTWDGKQERAMEFQIDTPCSGQRIDGSGASFVTFVFDGDKLHLGKDAGIKKGNLLLACREGKAFLWDGKRCTAQRFSFEHKIDLAAECRVESDTFVAVYPSPPVDVTADFAIDGNRLKSPPTSPHKEGFRVEKAASFTEAKTKLAALKKP